MKYLYSLVTFIFMMFAASCSDKNGNNEPEPDSIAANTYLVYIMGDNSLSQYGSKNIYSMKKGLLNATGEINLVIFKDNRDSGDTFPKLFQLKKVIDSKTKQAKIDTVYIKTYETELNSCDPEVFKDAVQTTFKMFDSTVKGIELWSHGKSWYPANNYTPQTRYIGEDDGRFFEVWDIRKALEECPHIDYICCDACFTGTAEIANEFDQVCDYLYGPITEIMGDGFNYESMIKILADCQSKSTVKETLEKCVVDFATSGFQDQYGYTITLLETAKADNLAKALGKLRKAVANRCEELSNNAASLESKFQHYGRTKVGTRYLFYEFQDYVDYLSESGNEEIQKIVKEIRDNDIVVKYACSDYFRESYESIDLSGCKGLGVTIPELLTLDRSYGKKFLECYGETKWGKNIGY